MRSSSRATAWDEERVRTKRGHSTSEPEDFLRIGERMNSWAMLVGLIGEGQEIHLGEEAGLEQWDDALAKMRTAWCLHCPDRVASIFKHAGQLERLNALDLTSSLRSHLAIDVQRWVHLLLESQLSEASPLAESVREQGFQVYLTSDLEAAKAYGKQRYAGEQDKRYGILASSKAQNLPPLGIRNDYSFTKNLREGPWYNDDPDGKYSCCQLTDVATEFSCQGLELDLPIVAWGSDLTWKRTSWSSYPQPRSKAKDPHRLRLNSYRVLLTRGRDGMVIFVPPTEEMASTLEALSQAGVSRLA